MRTTTQGQWRGLVFGLNTVYPVTLCEGIDDLPAIRTFDLPRPQSDGDWTGHDTVAARTVTLGLGIVGISGPDLEVKRQEAKTHLTKSTVPEVLRLSNGKIVYAKLRKAAVPSDMGHDWPVGDILLEFYCADPRVYFDDEQTIELIAGAARTTGRTYPRTYSWSYPQSIQPVSEGLLTNAGNTPAPIEVQLTGPLTTPVIEVVGHTYLRLNVDLASTDVLVVTRGHQITLNDQPRRDLIAPGSAWPEIPPGTWTVRLSAAAGTGQAIVTMRSASE